MSSKLMLLFLPLTLVLSGCSFFLDRHSPPADEQVELKTTATICLKSMPDRLGRFFSDSTSAAEVTESFDCLRTTLGHFQKFTRGSNNSSQYTADELRSFLNDDLTTDRKISAKFMREIMKVKAVFIGGSDRIYTRPELEQTQELLNVLENEIQSLRGKMRLLLFQAQDEHVGQNELKSAQRQLELSVAKILEASKASATTYDFADLEKFMSEVNLFIDNNQMFEQVVRWLPLAEKVKDLFWGDMTLGQNTQRDEVLGWSVRAYGMVLQYVYWIKNLTLSEPSDMEKLITFGDAVFDLVQESPALREKSFLSVTSIEAILDTVIHEGLFKTNIPLDVIAESFRRALSTMVEGPNPNRRSAFEVEVMTIRHIATLRFEWNSWVVVQKQLNRAFSKGLDQVTLQDVRKVLSSAEAEKDVDLRPNLKPGEADELRQTLKEWKALMSGPQPVLWNPKERLILARDSERIALGFPGMTTASMLRTFTRFVMRGYAKGTAKNVWDLNLTERDFTLFEEDFRIFGRFIYALDPRTPSPAARTFQEANFFTFSGNGDQELTATELFEEFNILTSAGGMIASELSDLGVKNNCAIEDRDVFGRQYLKNECFRKIFRANFMEVFSSAPGLQAMYMQLLGRVKEDAFYNDLWAMGIENYSRPGYTEYADIRIYSTVLHYIEILRLTYDRDRNMRLSQAEIAAAAPRFRSFITSRSPLGSSLVDQVFVCLVFEQRKPGGDWDTTRCLIQQALGYPDVGSAELLKVLSVLKTDLAENPSVPGALRRTSR